MISAKELPVQYFLKSTRCFRLLFLPYKGWNFSGPKKEGNSKPPVVFQYPPSLRRQINISILPSLNATPYEINCYPPTRNPARNDEGGKSKLSPPAT